METQISLTMVRGNSQSTRRSHLTNAQRQAIVKEFELRQNVGEDVYQKDLAEWAFKELQLNPCQASPLFLDTPRNDHMLMTNASSIQNRKRKSKRMHPKIEKALHHMGQ